MNREQFRARVEELWRERMRISVDISGSGYPSVKTLKAAAGIHHHGKRYYLPQGLTNKETEKAVKNGDWVECHCGTTLLKRVDAKRFTCLADCCLQRLLNFGELEHIKPPAGLEDWHKL